MQQLSLGLARALHGKPLAHPSVCARVCDVDSLVGVAAGLRRVWQIGGYDAFLTLVCCCCCVCVCAAPPLLCLLLLQQAMWVELDKLEAESRAAKAAKAAKLAAGTAAVEITASAASAAASAQAAA